MRIVIAAFGSRGDVEPALAVDRRLRELGHDVVVAVTADSAEFARQAGAEVSPISTDARGFLNSPESRDMLVRGDVRSYLGAMMDKKHEISKQLHADLIAAAEGADVVVGTRLVEEEMSSIAEWLDVPFVALHYAPVRRNSKLPAPLITTRRLTPPGNLATHLLADRLQWRRVAPDLNVLRRSLGLPEAKASAAVRLAASGALEIQAYSRHIVPELAGWGPRRPLIGNLRMSPEQRSALRSDYEDAGLDLWLADGEAPLYFGFGSMPIADAGQTLDMVRLTARRFGLRALVVAGWSDLPMSAGRDPLVRVVSSIDHDRVLPRCRLAVHHGGAGTTAAALGAGLPSVICSVFSDQPFWGRAVSRLRVGATIRRIDAGAPILIDLIEPLLNESTARRARSIATAMRAEDAAGEAARLIVAAT